MFKYTVTFKDYSGDFTMHIFSEESDELAYAMCLSIEEDFGKLIEIKRWGSYGDKMFADYTIYKSPPESEKLV